MGFFNRYEINDEVVDDYVRVYKLEDLKEIDTFNYIAGNIIKGDFSKEVLKAQPCYLKALVEQNWLILRELKKINSNKEK